MNSRQKDAVVDAITEMVDEAVDTLINERDFTDEVQSAVEARADVIGDEVWNYLDAYLTKKHNNLSTIITDVVQEQLQSMLPEAVKQATIALLSDREYLERISTALFEQNSLDTDRPV